MHHSLRPQHFITIFSATSVILMMRILSLFLKIICPNCDEIREHFHHGSCRHVCNFSHAFHVNNVRNYFSYMLVICIIVIVLVVYIEKQRNYN